MLPLRSALLPCALVASLLLAVGSLHAQAAPVPPSAPPAARAPDPPAARDPKPPGGIGGIVVGFAGLGFMVSNLATMPLCALDYYEEHDLRGICIGTSLGLAGAGLAAAIPGLVIGFRRRRVYKAWRARQQAAALPLRIGFAWTGERLWLGYRAAW